MKNWTKLKLSWIFSILATCWLSSCIYMATQVKWTDVYTAFFHTYQPIYKSNGREIKGIVVFFVGPVPYVNIIFAGLFWSIAVGLLYFQIKNQKRLNSQKLGVVSEND